MSAITGRVFLRDKENCGDNCVPVYTHTFSYILKREREREREREERENMWKPKKKQVNWVLQLMIT